MTSSILFETFRTWGEDPVMMDAVSIEKFTDQNGNPVAYELVTRSSHGSIAYIGFTPDEFIQFIEAIEDEKGYIDGR